MNEYNNQSVEKELQIIDWLYLELFNFWAIKYHM